MILDYLIANEENLTLQTAAQIVKSIRENSRCTLIMKYALPLIDRAVDNRLD